MSNVRAMDPKAVFPWVPKCDRSLPAAEQFQIMYSPLDMRKEAEINDKQLRSITKGKKSEYEYLISQADIKRLELSIKDWKNLPYPENHPDASLRGKPCPFSIENITCIPPDIRKEYIDDITGRAKAAEAEEDEEANLGEAKVA